MKIRHLTHLRHPVRDTPSSFSTNCNTATNCLALYRTATHCNTLQHAATHCNRCNLATQRATRQSAATILSRTATHCNTLQHTATGAIWLRKGQHAKALQLFRRALPLIKGHPIVILNIAAVARKLCDWVDWKNECELVAQVEQTFHCNTLQYTATHEEWV